MTVIERGRPREGRPGPGLVTRPSTPNRGSGGAGSVGSAPRGRGAWS